MKMDVSLDGSVKRSTIVEDSKKAVSSGVTSLNDAFKNALVIETVDLFASNLVLKQSGTGVLSSDTFNLEGNSKHNYCRTWNIIYQVSVCTDETGEDMIDIGPVETGSISQRTQNQSKLSIGGNVSDALTHCDRTSDDLH